ncbi:MAG: aminodeoxychorismate/anthranilate synthase component II, partial [Victivallaceae bacterium]|nr:aminodeoxychorismate/anthranilate synthase component II [Victivallaceae bacterium]
MIFVLDNYDSFTYNLVHLIYTVTPDVQVARNREITVSEILALKPEAILLSPGPGRPDKAGCMEQLIGAAAPQIPMLGVCLGHQAIGEVFGARVVPAAKIMHGKLSRITHDGKGVFQGVRQNFKAVRYHSLALEEASLPDELE